MFLSGQRPALFLEVYTLDPKTDVFLAISVGLQILIQPLLLLSVADPIYPKKSGVRKTTYLTMFEPPQRCTGTIKTLYHY